MSYLTLPGSIKGSVSGGVPSFSKAVISLWFRAPKEAVARAAASIGIIGTVNFEMMVRMLPLITFAKPQQNKNYEANPPVNVAVDMGAGGDPVVMASTGFTAGTPYDVNPCFIGFACFLDGRFQMTFNLQTGVEMVTTATTFVTTRVDAYSHTAEPPLYTGPIGENGWINNATQTTIADASYVDNAQLQVFRVDANAVLDPDRWHHVLLSFDISGEVSIGQPFPSSTCKMWYAIDDIDYRGEENMRPFRGNRQSDNDELGDNAIVTEAAWQNSSPTPTMETFGYEGFHYAAHAVPAPSGIYTGEGKAIPTAGEDFGIPSSSKYVEAIYHVEMAEFQMWTGVTLDTGPETNRRAFVDKDGYPVSPDRHVAKLGLSEQPSAAEALLGKRPEILLHGTSNWQNGINTGSLGVDDEGNVIVVKSAGGAPVPSGMFVPTAKIEPYLPDPSLHGEQGSTETLPTSEPVRLKRNARL